MPSSEHTAQRQAAALERIANALEKIVAGQSLASKNPYPHFTGPYRVTSEEGQPRT